MKKLMFVMSCVMLLAIGANAAVITEGFDYADGDLTGLNGGSGWTSAWGNPTGNWVVAGGKAKLENGGHAWIEYRETGLINSDVVWTGITMQLTGNDTSNNNMLSIAHFNGSVFNTWIAVRAGQVQTYTQKADGSGYEVRNAGTYVNGDEARVVARFQYGAGPGGSDVVDYWLNPTSETPLVTDSSHIITYENASVSFDRIWISGAHDASDGLANYIDDVRIETITGAVLPVQLVAPLGIAPDVSIDAIPTLEWLSGTNPNITQHVLYFSTDENWITNALPTDAAAIVLPVTTETYQHDKSLEYETTYYWRVDEARGDVSVPSNVDTGPVWSFTTRPEPGFGPIDVYLLAGQSNMQGVGYSSELTDEQKNQPEIMLYHTSSVSSGWPADTWMTLMPAGWSGFGPGGCFGPEIGFGLKIAQRYPTTKIAFIKHAAGGTGISPDCNASGWYPVYYPARPDADDQYVAFINAAHSALAQLETMGYVPRIKGMLWMQGETDAMKISTANDYSANFTLLISEVRQEFDLPEMPVIYGQVFPHFTGLFPADFPGKDILRQAQADIDQDSGHSDTVAGAFMVPTEALTVHSMLADDPRPTDDLHFGTAGQFGLGWLFAEKFVMQCDLNSDANVDLADFAVLANYWMNETCVHPDFCDGADLNFDGQVNTDDLNILFGHLLAGSGPYAHWKFDETSGDFTADSGVFGFDGVLENMTGTEWTTGKHGNALQFDGIDDYVEMSCFPGIPGTQSRTVCAWIKTTLGGDVVCWGSDYFDGAQWRLRIGGKTQGALGVQVNGGYIYGTTDMNDGQWHHIAAVLEDDGSADVNEIKLYVDGSLETTGKVLAKQIASSADMNVAIGAYIISSSPAYFAGMIDDVRIYDRVLSNMEIVDLIK